MKVCLDGLKKLQLGSVLPVQHAKQFQAIHLSKENVIVRQWTVYGATTRMVVV